MPAINAKVGVSVAMPGGIAKTSIMTGARNYLPRFGELPPPDSDRCPA